MKFFKPAIAIFFAAVLIAACTQPDKKSSGLNPKIAADYLGSADDLAVSDAEIAKAKENLGGSVIGLIPAPWPTNITSPPPTPPRRPRGQGLHRSPR